MICFNFVSRSVAVFISLHPTLPPIDTLLSLFSNFICAFCIFGLSSKVEVGTQYVHDTHTHNTYTTVKCEAMTAVVLKTSVYTVHGTQLTVNKKLRKKKRKKKKRRKMLHLLLNLLFTIFLYILLPHFFCLR